MKTVFVVHLITGETVHGVVEEMDVPTRAHMADGLHQLLAGTNTVCDLETPDGMAFIPKQTIVWVEMVTNFLDEVVAVDAEEETLG